MAKKKRKPAPAEPIPVPAVTAEDLARARKCLADVGRDLSYARAKKLLKADFPVSGHANAIVMALQEEGFEAADGKWFSHPDAPTDTGVVKGAREYDRMTLMSQTEPDLEIALPEAWNTVYLPGDVYEVRATETGWRMGRRIGRGPTRFVCRKATGYGRKRKGETVRLESVNPFCPLDFSIPLGEVPEGTDLANDVIEVELREELCDALADPVSPGPLPVRFVRRVGKGNDPLGEVAIASAEHGIPVEFSPETLAESEALPDEVDGRSMHHRVDLTDLPFVTIDGEDARDFDDAVFCTETEEGWRLLVAIADVSHYVKPGSALDRDAQARSTSVYFPASVVPMLPEKLSNGLCSLNPDVDRLVLVCDALVNREGAATAYQFYPAVIHSHARLTYDKVWRALQGDPEGVEAVGPRLSDLKRLHALFKALRSARKARHALDFETEESQALFDASGVISGFRVREYNDAHRLIEECMLVANVAAADFVLRKKAQTLFRVHPKPEEDRVRTLRSVLQVFGKKLPEATPEAFAKLIDETKGDRTLQTAILRSMSRAQYQPENVGHFGLQYGAYAHFTSPIRRYPDLLLHRTIKGILAKKSYAPAIAFDDAALLSGYHARKLGSRPEAKEAKPKNRREEAGAAWRRLGIITSAAERRADDASRDVMNYLKCDFIRKQSKRTFTAAVTGMIPAGVFVSLEEWPIEGFVHISNLGWGYFEYDEAAMTMTSYEEMMQVRIGDRVKVRLETVDMDERRISFTLESNLTRHVVKGGGGRRRGAGRFRRFGDEWDDDDGFW